MSIKIWCDECKGAGWDISTKKHYGGGSMSITSRKCPHCSGKGYIEKGCENCGHVGYCESSVFFCLKK